MATFRDILQQEARTGMRDYFERNTGIFGQAMRSSREKKQEQQQVEKQLESISSATLQVKSSKLALMSMETSFIQISKNMQLIAQAMNAEVTLQEETDKNLAKLEEIAERRRNVLKDAQKKYQQDLNKLNKKIVGDLKQQQKDSSLLDKLGSLIDDFVRGGKGGKGGKGGGGRTPPGRTQPSREPPRRLPGASQAPGQQGRVPSGGGGGVPSTGGGGVPSTGGGGVPSTGGGGGAGGGGRLPGSVPTGGGGGIPSTGGGGNIPSTGGGGVPSTGGGGGGGIPAGVPSGGRRNPPTTAQRQAPDRQPPRRLQRAPSGPSAPGSAYRQRVAQASQQAAVRAQQVAQQAAQRAAVAQQAANQAARQAAIRGGAQVAGRVISAAAAPVALAAGAYQAGRVARETQLGERLAQGQGGRAQTAFRQMNAQYGAEISPESAKAILDQPDSPGKRRDVQAFGGLERLQKLAAQAKPVAAPAQRSSWGAQEHVFTGPMAAPARPAAAAAPARPAAAAAPAQRPAAASSSPGASQQQNPHKDKTDDQGPKVTGPGTPMRKEGPYKAPKNVIINDRVDLSQAKPELIARIYAAAKKWGKRLVITSAYRSDAYQAQLYVRGAILNEPRIYMPSLPKTPQKVIYKGVEYNVPGNGRHNAHLELAEIDISPGWDNKEWRELLARYGVHFPWGADDKPHTRIMSNAPPIPLEDMPESFSGDAPSAAPPPNVVMSGSGVPVTSGSGGFVTSGAPPVAATRPPVTAAPAAPRPAAGGGSAAGGVNVQGSGHFRERALAMVRVMEKFGITNPYAKAILISAAAKESGLNPLITEYGASHWMSNVNSGDLTYFFRNFPQLGPGGVKAIARGKGEKGFTQAELKAELAKGDQNFFELVYGGYELLQAAQNIEDKNVAEQLRKFGRMNPEKGDGWRYRGKGYIGITGRTNYRSVGSEIGQDLEGNPDKLVSDPETAGAAALAYMWKHSIPGGRGTKDQFVRRMNALQRGDVDSELRDVLLTIAGRGKNTANFLVQGSNLRQQYEKAGKFIGQAGSVVGANLNDYSIQAATSKQVKDASGKITVVAINGGGPGPGTQAAQRQPVPMVGAS